MAQNQNIADLADTIRFVLEIDKLKGILRKVKPIGDLRYENTAEHSWQIAVFAMSLAEILELSIDVNRAVAMLLLHDLGEIDAGDKFVFAQDGWEERRAAELRAVERIFGIAPERTAKLMLSLWMDFDVGETAEARFARAVDRSMPVLLNLSNGGGSWLENGVTFERVTTRVGPEIEAGCPELWSYLKEQLEAARHKGFFASS